MKHRVLGSKPRSQGKGKFIVMFAIFAVIAINGGIVYQLSKNNISTEETKASITDSIGDITHYITPDGGKVVEIYWKGNKSFARTFPITNGQINWGSPTNESFSPAMLPAGASGEVRGYTISQLPENSRNYVETIWVGNKGYTRFIPIKSRSYTPTPAVLGLYWNEATAWTTIAETSIPEACRGDNLDSMKQLLLPSQGLFQSTLFCNNEAYVSDATILAGEVEWGTGPWYKAFDFAYTEANSGIFGPDGKTLYLIYWKDGIEYSRAYEASVEEKYELTWIDYDASIFQGSGPIVGIAAYPHFDNSQYILQVWREMEGKPMVVGYNYYMPFDSTTGLVDLTNTSVFNGPYNATVYPFYKSGDTFNGVTMTKLPNSNYVEIVGVNNLIHRREWEYNYQTMVYEAGNWYDLSLPEQGNIDGIESWTQITRQNKRFYLRIKINNWWYKKTFDIKGLNIDWGSSTGWEKGAYEDYYLERESFKPARTMKQRLVYSIVGKLMIGTPSIAPSVLTYTEVQPQTKTGRTYDDLGTLHILPGTRKIYGPISVKITGTSGKKIMYALNKAMAQEYTAPFTVDSTTIVTANYSDNTEITSATYTLITEFAEIVFSPEETNFLNDVTVSLTSSDPTFAIKYSLNGGSEQTYSAPFKLTDTTKVEAWYNGHKDNSLVSKTYTKAEISAPSDLQYTCADSGSVVDLTWSSGGSGAKAYLVTLKQNGQVVTSMVVESEEKTMTNLTANTDYGWSVQSLLSSENTQQNFDRTSDKVTEGPVFRCVPTNPETPTINYILTLTFLPSLTVSGTKTADSSIYVNGNEVIASNANTQWATDLQLSNIGMNNFIIQSKKNGVMSTEVPVNIERCMFGDINCDTKVNIVDFSWFVQAIRLYVFTQQRQPFMELADMNNGAYNRGDGIWDLYDFYAFKDEYIKHNM